MARRGRVDPTLAAVFADPLDGNIHWADVERLLGRLGAASREGGGSVVTFELSGEKALFHRPHPRRECGRNLVKRVREFLTRTGHVPDVSPRPPAR